MKNEIWNWSDVRVFLAVLREGSTLAASRKLGMAQPTVARRIEALEHQTGLTLFDRDTRGFKPTESARSLVPLAEAFEDVAKNFIAKTQELANQRPIRITSPGSFSDEVMYLFSEFNTLHPEIIIEFVHSVRALDLTAGEADIAFRVSMSAPDPSLVGRKVGTEHFALYGGQKYADQFGLPESMDDLRGHRFVTFKRDDVPHIQHDWLSSSVPPDQIVGTFGDIDLMYSAIKAGTGLGLVHTRWADTQHTLLRCFDNIEELSRPVIMLIAPDAYRRREVKAFTKFFAPRYAAIFK